MNLLSCTHIKQVNGGNSESGTEGFISLVVGIVAALIIQQPQQQRPALSAVAYTNTNNCLYNQSEPCFLAHEISHTHQQG